MKQHFSSHVALLTVSEAVWHFAYQTTCPASMLLAHYATTGMKAAARNGAPDARHFLPAAGFACAAPLALAAGMLSPHVAIALGASAAVLASATAACRLPLCSSAGWALLALVYGARARAIAALQHDGGILIVNLDHDVVAFFLHCFNLFIVAELVAIRGLGGAAQLGRYAGYAPGSLLALRVFSFFVDISEGSVLELEWMTPPLLGLLVEVVFVTAYFVGAEHQRNLSGVEVFRIWAVGIFLLHPIIWRTLIPVAGYLILSATTCPFFYLGYRSRRGASSELVRV